MRVHHLNCATLCPWGGRLVSGEGGVFGSARLVCHCLLIESADGLVLVDTGLGSHDLAAPVTRLGSAFMHLLRPLQDPAEPAVHQIRALGFAPEDVRHVIVTHLDPDHAGGISDFPNAKVHVHRAEHLAMEAQASPGALDRYRTEQWAHGPEWVLHEPVGDTWKGFEAVQVIERVGPDLLLIPLPGHSVGHSGIAVRTPNGWLLHAGDAFDYRDEIHVERPRTTFGLRLFQRFIATDWSKFMNNHERLRELARDAAGDVRIICAHDPVLFAQASEEKNR